MKIVPVICFALAAAVAGSTLPVSSGYAAMYPTGSQRQRRTLRNTDAPGGRDSTTASPRFCGSVGPAGSLRLVQAHMKLSDVILTTPS
jgi:hypothetical protein